MRKNCDQEKVLKIEAESGEFAKILRSLEHSNSERSEQVLVTECFLTCSWRFLISGQLEQLEFKLDLETCRKNWKKIFLLPASTNLPVCPSR